MGGCDVDGCYPSVVACERWSSVFPELAVYLLKQGARFNIRDGKIFPKLSGDGNFTIEMARKMINEEAEALELKRKTLYELRNPKTYFGLLPSDLFRFAMQGVEREYHSHYRWKQLNESLRKVN